MDKIFINDLQIETTIGIYEWEKRIKQIVSIDIVMDADIAKASQSDKIADTLDYKAVSKKVINFVENSKVELVEVLVEKIAKIIIDNVGQLILFILKKKIVPKSPILQPIKHHKVL